MDVCGAFSSQAAGPSSRVVQRVAMKVLSSDAFASICDGPFGPRRPSAGSQHQRLVRNCIIPQAASHTDSSVRTYSTHQSVPITSHLQEPPTKKKATYHILPQQYTIIRHTRREPLTTLRLHAFRNDRIRRTALFRRRNLIERIPWVLRINLQKRSVMDRPQPHGLGGVFRGADTGCGATG